MSNKQFLIWVAVFLGILFAALAIERAMLCEERGGLSCRVGPRVR
jgi:hypothetical protein